MAPALDPLFVGRQFLFLLLPQPPRGRGRVLKFGIGGMLPKVRQHSFRSFEFFLRVDPLGGRTRKSERNAGGLSGASRRSQISRRGPGRAAVEGAKGKGIGGPRKAGQGPAPSFPVIDGLWRRS